MVAIEIQRRSRLGSDDSTKSLILTNNGVKKEPNEGFSTGKSQHRAVSFSERASVRVIKPSFTLVESDLQLWYGKKDYQEFKREIMAGSRRLVMGGHVPEQAFANFIRLDEASRETTKNTQLLRQDIANSYMMHSDLVGYERVVRQVACNSLVRRSEIQKVIDSLTISEEEKPYKCRMIALADTLYASHTAMALRVSLIFEDANPHGTDSAQNKAKDGSKLKKSSSERKLKRSSSKKSMKMGRSSYYKELGSRKKKSRELSKTSSDRSLKLSKTESKKQSSSGEEIMSGDTDRKERRKALSSKGRKSKDDPAITRSSSCKDMGDEKKKKRELRKSSSTGSLKSGLKKSEPKRLSSSKDILCEEPATSERKKLSKDKSSKKRGEGKGW